jgi:hypothetical protein
VNTSCSVIAAVSYGVASEFIAMEIVTLWMIPNGYCLYLTFRKAKTNPFNENKTGTRLLDERLSSIVNLDAK